MSRANKIRFLFSWPCLLGLWTLLLAGCGSDEPVVVVTLLGLSSDIASVRVHARYNTAPAKAAMEFTDGLGPSTVDYQFAVRLPRGTRGKVSLSIETLTQDGCFVSDDPLVLADVGPGQVVPVTVTVTRLPQSVCPLLLTKTSQGPGVLRYQGTGEDCRNGRCTCASSCELRLPRGSQVSISADGENQTSLLAWADDCGGFKDCSVTLNGRRQVRATFMPTVRVRRMGTAANDDAMVFRSVLPDAIRAQYGLREISCRKSLEMSAQDSMNPCSIGVPPDTILRLSGPTGGPSCFLGFESGPGCTGSACVLTIKDSIEIPVELASCPRSTPFPAASGANLSVFATPDVVWVGSEGKSATPLSTGLHILERSSGVWTNLSENYTNVKTLWADRISGELWYGGYRSGANYLVRLSQRGTKENVAVSISNVNQIWGRSPDEMWMINNDIYPFGNQGYKNGLGITSALALAPASPTDLWVVGNQGIIWRIKPGGYLRADSPTMELLHDVWSYDENNAWAVGDNGTILMWNGSKWAAQASMTGQDLKAVWGTTSRNVWAVGSSVLLHWNGTAWFPIPQSSSNDYRDIHGADEKTFWIVDYAGGVTTIAR